LEKSHAAERDGYRRALAAAQRAPKNLRPEGQAYVRYWIGRLKFGVGYFDTIEAVKKAATAEKAALDAKKNGDAKLFKTKLAEAVALTKAAQATGFAAVEAMAGAAKNRADCGAIATMAEYVDRALKRKVEELRSGE
jgi:hypothetical protein